MFGNSEIGFLLLFTHILSCITVGIILGLKDRFLSKKTVENISKSNYSIKSHIDYKNKYASKKIPCNISNLGEIIGNSIKTAINSVIMIGGFIVLFSVIISILEDSNILNFICGFLSKLLNLNESVAKGLLTRIS